MFSKLPLMVHISESCFKATYYTCILSLSLFQSTSFLAIVTTTVISSQKEKKAFVLQGAIHIYHTKFCLHIICITKICLCISKICEFLEDGADMGVFMPEF